MSAQAFTARDPGTDQLNPLQAFIAEHCANTGDTLLDIARRGGLSRQTVSTLVNRPTMQQMPRQATLRKLATGLGVSSRFLGDLCNETAYGSRDRRPSDYRLNALSDLASRLSPTSVDVLLATARALRASESA